VLDIVFGFMDNMPCVIAAFDDKNQFIFANKLTLAQGYDLESMLGKSMYDIAPSEDALKINKGIEYVIKTGKNERLEASVISLTGQKLIEEYLFSPIKNANGKIIAVMLVATDITHFTKINEYQEFETNAIKQSLKEGLGVGKLQFSYKPQPHDTDTTVAAASYEQISEMLKQSVSFIKDYVNEVNGKLASIATGDLTVTINRDYLGDFNTIKNSINNITSNLHKTMMEISKSSEQVLQGANHISANANSLSYGATEQSASVQELNATFEVISHETKQNADNASHAHTLSSESTQNAQEGNNAMKQMLEAMSQIKQSSNNISQINKSIQDISAQTNLLALNASIEATRAGELGKGFSVVADEVRILAASSQIAATETSDLIEHSINCIEMGSDIAQSTADALSVIVNSVQEVLHIVDAIAISSHKQAEIVSHISNSIGQISSVVETNSAVSTEAAATAEELSSQAESLRQLVAYFKL